MPVPQIGNPGGFALGARVFTALTNVGIRQTGWRWRYNTKERRASFPPHRVLAGLNFDQLPSVDGYYPGDHKGCRCQAIPVLRGPDGRFVVVP